MDATDDDGNTLPRPPSSRFESYLILANIGKRQNWGTLLRSAAAFGVTTVFVVGEKRLKTFGNQGTTRFLTTEYFETLHALQTELVARHITVCGIEICETALPVDAHPFTGSTAFMLGNEGCGMTTKQLQLCDLFVYIPHYRSVTASLNVAVAGSIVLHHFALWSGFSEAPRTGQKFHVSAPRSKLERFRHPTPEELALRSAKREERRRRRWRIDDSHIDSNVGRLFELNEVVELRIGPARPK